MVCRLLTGSRAHSSREDPRRGKHWQVLLVGTFCGLLEDCLPTGPGHLAERLHLAYGLRFLLGNAGLAKVFIFLNEQPGLGISLTHCSMGPSSPF